MPALEEAPPEMEAPPDELETGGNVYFDAGFIPEKKKAEAEKPVPPATVAKPQKTLTGDAKATFGSFLRSLRKTGKSGVLFAICMDLDYAYQGEVFTLYTQSETIYRSLSKPEHQEIIKASLASIGIYESEYTVMLKGKKSDEFNQGLDEIRQTFDGVKIEIK